MNHAMQWTVVILLALVAILQLGVIRELKGLKPAPAPPQQAAPRLPSLKEIDGRIMHRTMHHGQHFSASGRISTLEGTMNSRFDAIEAKLASLSGNE